MVMIMIIIICSISSNKSRPQINTHPRDLIDLIQGMQCKF